MRKIEHLRGRVLKNNSRRIRPQVRATWAPGQGLWMKESTQGIGRTKQKLAANEVTSSMASQSKDQGNRGRTWTRTVVKKRCSPCKKWSEGQTRMETHHHGKLLRGTQLYGNPQKNNHHIIVKIQPDRKEKWVAINEMIDSGATE